MSRVVLFTMKVLHTIIPALLLSISVVESRLGGKRGLLDPKSTQDKATAKLGDGCYHVFLDLGANIGIHGRFVFEPHKYPDIKSHTKHIFDNYFGIADKSRNPRNICVFAFEPNPAHAERHKVLQDMYGKFGLRYTPILAGVSDQDDMLTFYHQDGGKQNEWGFSTTKYSDETIARINVTVSEVKVPVIRLSSWLMRHIYDRQIPDYHPLVKEMEESPDAPPPRVVAKMDVEGQEAIMLPDLMYSGALCKTIDYIFGEFPHGFDSDIRPDKVTGRGGIVKEGFMIKNYYYGITTALKSLRNSDCKTEGIENFDDENYLFDGIALPGEDSEGRPWWQES